MQYVSDRNKSARGNSIILMLPLTIVAVAVIQLSLFQSANFTKTVTNFRITGTRDTLVTNIKAYASMSTTFRSSLHPSLPANTNIELQNCVLGGVSPCESGVEKPVALYYPISSPSSSPSSPLSMISGRASLDGVNSPAALYDVRGQLCSQTGQANADCPFEVVTSFIPVCAGGAATCATAESISVRYSVRKATASLLLQKTALRVSIDQQTSPILVSKILPGGFESATHNVIISALTDVTDGNDKPQDPVWVKIRQAIIDTKTITNEDHIQGLTDLFYELGYRDPELITTIAKIAYDKYDTAGVIRAVSELKIQDTKTAAWLTDVGIPDAKWLQTVRDLNIQDTWLAGSFYWWFGESDPSRIVTALNAVKGLPQDDVTLAISRQITDPAKAQEAYKLVKSETSNDWIGAGIIDGHWNEDPAKMKTIIDTASSIDDYTSSAFSELGLTDPALVKKLYNLTSEIEERSWAREAVLYGKGDYEKTRLLVQEYMQRQNEWKAEQEAAAKVADNPPPPAPTPSQTTEVSGPSPMTLLSTCTTCSAVTF